MREWVKEVERKVDDDCIQNCCYHVENVASQQAAVVLREENSH